MKILICYFSGTGNTKKVVTKAVEAFNSLGHTTDAINIEEGVSPDFAAYSFAYSEDDTGTNKEYCKKAYIRYFKEAEEKIGGTKNQ